VLLFPLKASGPWRRGLCQQYSYRLADALKSWIEEDSPLGDITTDAIFEDASKEVTMLIEAREKLYFACPALFEGALGALGTELTYVAREGWKEGTLLKVKGNVKDILMIERTLLNFLIHVLSISTEVRRVRELLDAHGFSHVRLAVTRKTVPGMRLWAKLFSRAAGADTHRLSLSDMILVKDTHASAYGDLLEAVKRARERASFAHKVEAEVTTLEEALAVLPYVDIIMLDNMEPKNAKEVACEIKKKRRDIIVEVSGRITRSNVINYLNECIDVVSMGYLTLSPPRVDIGAKVV